MMTTVMPETPQTPTAAHRYPSSLSQASGGPSRPQRTYPVPSIDSSIASPPSHPAPLHEYTSLQELLRQAGYKETRVYTPEAEKVRRHIKKTLDDSEDEVAALYGTYGFDRERATTHVHQNVTEPMMPMKRSTSILRSLALQAAARSSAPVHDGTPDHSWWSAWGKGHRPILSPDSSTEVGLGLAKGGEGVRKVKSAWDVDADRERRAETDSPRQEERPPLPQLRQASAPQDIISATGYTSTTSFTAPVNKSIFQSPPPPRPLSDDAFGYCPLPEDYEAQCVEDEALYAMGANDYDVYSLGSCSATDSLCSTMHSRNGSEDRAEREIREFEDEMMDDARLEEVNDVGKRLMARAVEYDEDMEIDSPPMRTWSLPKVEDKAAGKAPSIPIPSPPEATEEVATQPREDKAEPEKKTLEHGDRAAKIRLARSTPNLKKSQVATDPLPPGWLSSIKSALLGPGPAVITPKYKTPAFKVSAAATAQPRLATASPVICDSISNEAEDLPPVPSRNDETSGAKFLRLRPSLARLRDAVLGAQATTSTEDTLVLSPRLDWKEQGEQFAGWSPMRKLNNGIVTNQEQEFEAAVTTDDTGVDYSKSFFYKPCTPPRTRVPGAPETPKVVVQRGLKKQRSIKSLQAALLLPVAASPLPPVPAIPSHLMTPKRIPALAIQSPQATQPRKLVLEGEEFDPQSLPGTGRRGRGTQRGPGVKRRKSKKRI